MDLATDLLTMRAGGLLAAGHDFYANAAIRLPALSDNAPF
jgi:hypothetical protein